MKLKKEQQKFIIEATDKEVEKMLIKEAKKRGFKDKGMYEDIHDPYCGFKELHFKELEYDRKENWLYDGYGSVIFCNGKWSTIETITKEDAEKQLGKTIV